MSLLARSLRCERLEDRRMLAPIVVTTDQDLVDFNDGKTSLREAIFAANTVPGPDEIVFDFGHDGPATIFLEHGELQIEEALTIAGAGAGLLTIDAQQQSRIFNITATTGEFVISGMTLTRGSTSGVGTAFAGGAIRSVAANLTINHSVITGNSTTGAGARGGAIYSPGHLHLNASRISNNHTQGNNSPGGALFVTNASIIESVFENNRTYGSNSGGGAMAGNPRRLGGQISHSSFLDNKTFGSNSPGGAITSVGGLSVNDGTFTGNTTYGLQGHGGAIHGGSMSISSSSFADNTVHNGNGGAIHAYNLTIASSSLTNNSVNSGTGGAILGQWNLDIVDSVLSKNQSIGNNGGGGAIAQTGFSNRLTILRSKITDNESIGMNVMGGGIRTHVPTTITDSEISGNRVVGQGGRGGGLFAESLTTITDSTISGNHAIGGGGAGGGVFLMSTNSVHTLLNSTLSGNQITGEQSRGAGLYSMGRINIRHSTVTGNRINSEAGQAGGLWLTQPQSMISHSIVAGNLVGSVASDLRGQPQLSYSLIGTRAGTEFTEAPVGSPDADGNLIGGPVHGVIDPLLAPLADNGGPTLTHALLPGSPAINAGDPSLGNAPEFDQRGAPFARIAEGRIDIGAFESQPNGGLFNGDFDGDGDVDGRDFLLWQRGYTMSGPHVEKSTGDATGNQLVDGNDLAVWQATYSEELSAVSAPMSARLTSRAESPEPERSMAPWAVPRLDDARDRVPCYDDICDPVFYLPTSSRDYAEILDRAFDHWLPPRRLAADFGDIVTRRGTPRYASATIERDGDRLT